MAIIGKENLSNEGELIIPNKISLKVLRLLERAVGKDRIAYLVESTFMPAKEIVKSIGNRLSDGIAFKSSEACPSALRRAITEKMAAGFKVVYLPGIPHKIKGVMSDIPNQIIKFLESVHIAPVPMFVAFYNKKDVINSVQENDAKEDATVHVLPKLPPGPEMASRIMHSWLECSYESYKVLPQFVEGSLPSLMVRSLKKHWNSEVIDGMTEEAKSFGRIFAAALALAKKIPSLTSAKRVGIILPPGGGAIVANLACVFAKRIPVNFNYTVSELAFKSSRSQSGVDVFITADKFVRKLEQFPWPDFRDMFLLDLELPKMMGAIKKWFIYAKLMPADLIIKQFGLNEFHGDDEAVLLFTSGSSGVPKGVPLSHANVIGNVTQCSSKLSLEPRDRILGVLPVFHSFGLLVGIWYAIARGSDVVTYPTPLETKKIAELVYKYKTRLVILTPTFLRAHVKYSPVDAFKHVYYMVTGAEKLPQDLAEQFAEKFGVFPTEAYGLTESSPGLAANLANLKSADGQPWIIPNHKPGAAGAIIPGVAVRITCLYTGEVLPHTKSGMVWVKGVNVFKGYLGGKVQNEPLFEDGWMRTGDIGHCDDDGFLYVDGRLSRFSKVAGEMIPHEAVELAVAKFLCLDPYADEKQVAIVGIPDAKKGESMALLSTTITDYIQQAMTTLRGKLLEHGYPATWCPREIVPVESIPMLGTGKIDMMKCKRLAFEALGLSEK